MATPTPALETVIAAVVAEMDAIAPDIGEVRGFEHTLDSEVEFIELFQDINGENFDTDIWLVDVTSIDEIEGEAAAEQYSIYNLRIRYISVRKNQADWSKQARTLFEKVRDKLNKNAAVFAIGGQRQLQTPEIVALSTHGFTTIEDQTVYQSEMTLQVEARRFT